MIHHRSTQGIVTPSPAYAGGGTPSPDEQTAAKTAAGGAAGLIPQAHGGALLAGGKPGNQGGGRPKEALRQRMREMLNAVLDAMSSALRGERTPANARRAILEDPRIVALGAEAQTIIGAVCADHLTATLTAREIGQFHETLARYGVGTQQEVEQTKSETRYVIRLPARPSAKPELQGPVTVIEGSPAVLRKSRESIGTDAQ